jgi:hypothetical protein
MEAQVKVLDDNTRPVPVTGHFCPHQLPAFELHISPYCILSALLSETSFPSSDLSTVIVDNEFSLKSLKPEIV